MLTSAVDRYLELRRACGFQMQEADLYLHSFARFASDRGESHVRRQTAIDWASSGSSAQAKEKRIQTVRRFACHLRAEDAAHDLPPAHIFTSGRPKRPVPYIFTPEEVVQILHAASKLGPVGSIRPLTFYTLFGLLAATGLRISEALALRHDDITEDGLLIRETKFRKSRLVPLHETTTVELQHYLEQRRKTGGLDDYLFISLKRRRLSYQSVAYAFCSIVKSIGLQQRPGQRAPRLHHLRHSFAVRCLETCPRGRESVSRHLLALSTYMGHAHVSDTYWYLQATPHLMADIADACEASIEGAEP